MWQLISRACGFGCTTNRKKRGQTDQINKVQMRRSHEMNWGLLPSGSLWHRAKWTRSLQLSSPTLYYASWRHQCWTSLPNIPHHRNPPAALQSSKGSLVTQHDITLMPVMCVCVLGNKRASSARHVMPLPLLQCIRRKAHKDNVSHVTSAAAAVWQVVFFFFCRSIKLKQTQILYEKWNH